MTRRWHEWREPPSEQGGRLLVNLLGAVLIVLYVVCQTRTGRILLAGSVMFALVGWLSFGR